MKNYSNLVRKTVSVPIIFGFFLNIMYGMFFYKKIYFSIDCNFLIPKLEKFSKMFSPSDMCYANNLLSTSLILFILIDILVIILVFIINYKYIIPKIDNLREKLKIVIPILLVEVFIIYIYIFSNLKNGHRYFPEKIGVNEYIYDQIFKLHVETGLMNFVLLAILLSAKFSGIDMEKKNV